MATLKFFKNYNNYFNRIVKHDYSKATLNGYETVDKTNINFDEQDGLYTEAVVNWTENWAPNYLMVNPIIPEGADAEWIVNSSWFVLEWKKIRLNQYRAVLKRDVIADNYNSILNAPTYIEKGFINNINDPMLYNKESLSVNQIKQYEIPIKDETECGWVVGYIPRDFADDAAGKDIITNAILPSLEADITVNSIEEWTWYKNVISNPNIAYLVPYTEDYEVKFSYKAKEVTIIPDPVSPEIDWESRSWEITLKTVDGTNTTEQTNRTYSDNPSWWNNYKVLYTAAGNPSFPSNSNINALSNAFNNNNFKEKSCLYYCANNSSLEAANSSTMTSLNSLQDKIIKDTSNGKYYRIQIIENADQYNYISVSTSSTEGTNFYSAASSVVNGVSRWSVDGQFTSGDISIKFVGKSYGIYLTQISINCKVNINETRLHLVDAPYDMFCIPYSDTLSLYDGTDHVVCSKDVALSLGQQICAGVENQDPNQNASTGVGDAVYDVQLLPYCPARYLVVNSQNPSVELDLTYNGSANVGIYDTIYAMQGSTQVGKLGFVIWCMSSSFVANNNTTLPAYTQYSGETNPVKLLKLSNDCDMYRLSSGTFNGMFEFSPAKSKGIDGFTIECTYKPFNPFIHVTPKLKGLYGNNYSAIDDMRGLICSGDFSLARLSNQWANYELNNKNYQNIFDRQIQNLDVQNDIAREQQLFAMTAGVVTGTATGATTGAIVGGKFGGGYGAMAGAIAGGVIGAGTSIVGGAMDYQNMVKLQEENRSFSIDMYNYNLQNIKAIPSSLTKTSSLLYNTRIWPFVEYYTCTNEEKAAYINKLNYDGMTVMRIDNISSFIDPEEKHYLQGKVIRLENAIGESSTVAEIYNEIFKGVFI